MSYKGKIKQKWGKIDYLKFGKEKKKKVFGMNNSRGYLSLIQWRGFQ